MLLIFSADIFDHVNVILTQPNDVFYIAELCISQEDAYTYTMHA